jgi:NAD(P)-dependent dehydrogenase (short-subunit alcohol dehydrogenase family)
MTTVVVSGASRGIGLALVKEYLANSHDVVATCRNLKSAHALKALRENNPRLRIVEADVGMPTSTDSLKEAIGDAPVALLLNVAGTFHLEKEPADIDLDAWKVAFDVMTIGPFRTTLAILSNLEAAQGKIVSISSQVGSSTWPLGGFYSYGAAKAGLNRAMKSLAIDLKGRGISVALVHPGYVKTEMGGPDADISPEESARGIKAVSDRLELASTGNFYDWDGTSRSW